RVVMEMGVGLIGVRLLLAALVSQRWHLYVTLGVMVGGGSVCLGYTGQGLFLPNWFVRRRGLAMSVAFSGVGIGSIILLPWLQSLIGRAGWRAACWAMGILVLALLAPLNLLLKRRPEDMGLEPDGDRSLLVDRARILHRPLLLVRGAGAPDQVPDRDRLQPKLRGVGPRLREPGRHPGPDHSGPSLGSDRPRVGVGGGGFGIRRLLHR